MRQVTGCLALSALFALPLESFAHPGCESVWEFPELVPQEYWDALEARAAAREELRHRQDLTPVEVEIDPLGADPDTPWTIFQTVNVRSEPSTRGGSSTVVGSLTVGSQIVATYYVVLESDEEWMEIDFNDTLAWFTRTRATRPHPFNVQAIAQHINIPIGTELVNRWWGVPISYEADDLAVIPWEYTTQVAGREYLLRQDALDSFLAMRAAAAADGINLYALSPYRSGERQMQIYLNNVNNNLAQRSSAPPGHSEHQLGTTLDFSASVGGSFIGRNSPAHVWLTNNGADYGWVQTYTADNIDETGYIEEPWHWRFFGVVPESPLKLTIPGAAIASYPGSEDSYTIDDSTGGVTFLADHEDKRPLYSLLLPPVTFPGGGISSLTIGVTGFPGPSSTLPDMILADESSHTLGANQSHFTFHGAEAHSLLQPDALGMGSRLDIAFDIGTSSSFELRSVEVHVGFDVPVSPDLLDAYLIAAGSAMFLATYRERVVDVFFDPQVGADRDALFPALRRALSLGGSLMDTGEGRLALTVWGWLHRLGELRAAIQAIDGPWDWEAFWPAYESEGGPATQELAILISRAMHALKALAGDLRETGFDEEMAAASGPHINWRLWQATYDLRVLQDALEDSRLAIQASGDSAPAQLLEHALLVVQEPDYLQALHEELIVQFRLLVTEGLPLYETNFETDQSAHFALSEHDAGDNAWDFQYDYSTFSQSGGGFPQSIEPSPFGTGTGTRALRLATNLAGGAVNSVTATLTAIAPQDNMRITIDTWQNFGTSFTTEAISFGATADPILPAMAAGGYFADTNPPFNGLFFSISSDGGQLQDYRYYDGGGGPAWGDNAARADFLGIGAIHNSAFGDVFPSPPYPVSGAPGKGWNRWEIEVFLGTIRLYVTRSDGERFLLADWFRPNAGTPVTGLLPHVGTQDLFQSLAAPTSDQFVLIDYMRVEPLFGWGTLPPLPGDINGDGWISVADVTALANYLNGHGTIVGNPDFNGDGIFDEQDVIDLAQAIADGTVMW